MTTKSKLRITLPIFAALAIILGVNAIAFDSQNLKRTPDMQKVSEVGATSTEDVGFADVALSGGDITTPAGVALDLLTNNQPVMVGTGSPGDATAAGDLYVQDVLEVDGRSYFDNIVNIRGHILLNSNNKIYYDGAYGGIYFRNTYQTNDTMMINTGNTTHHIIVCDDADFQIDFGHANTADPTIYIHSNDATSVNEWLSLAYIGASDYATIATGAGGLNLAPAGNLLFTPGVAQKIYIDATTTPHTDTAGIIDINAEAGETGIVVIDSALTSESGGLGAGETIYDVNLNLYGDGGDNATSSLMGINIAADATGSAKRYAIYVNSANFDYTLWSMNDIYMGASDIETDTSTGMSVATATNQKLGFYGATPIVCPSAYTQTFATADKTHAARTCQTLTDNSGGGATNDTIEVIAIGGNVGQDIPDAIAELADELNKCRADQQDTAAVLNSLIDDLQALGLVQ